MLENGWILYAQDSTAGDNIARIAFIEGSPVQTSTFSNQFTDTTAGTYKFVQSELGIKVHSPRSFSLLLNQVEVAHVDGLTSDILSAGWGAGQVGNANPAYISYPVRFRNKMTYGVRPLKVAIVGDSTADPNLSISWVNHFKRIASGAGGVQFAGITNLAVAGQTSLQQRDAFLAADLSGHDYALVQVGINDIGSGVAPADTVQAITDIINRCTYWNMIPIIGHPRDVL